MGSLGQIDKAVKKAVNGLALAEGFVGAALYVPDDKTADHLIPLHISSKDISPDHKSFINDHLMRRRIRIDGTAAGAAFESGQSVLIPSRMAAHDCVNIVTQAPNVADMRGRYVLQLAFREGAALPALQRYDGGIQRLEKRAVDRLSRSAGRFLGAYGRDLTEKLDIEGTAQPNGVLVFTDISNYSQALKAMGLAAAQRITERLQESAEAAANRYGGRLVRSEGDGVWIGFSQLDDRALRAAQDVQADFSDIRAAYGENLQRNMNIRSVIASGYMHVRLRGDAFGNERDYNSLAFFTARLMAESAPRDRDIILFSREAAAALALKQSTPKIVHPVQNSTLIKDMLAL
ncbi:MAG: hypothetical protein ACK4VI_01575 [Alphaproteobacteria bacterium]